MEEIFVKDIKVFLTYKRIKNINLRIDSVGNVKVSAPYLTSKRKIINFIEQKYGWIESSREKIFRKNEQKQKYQQLSSRIQFVTGDQVYLWGKKYSIELLERINWSCYLNDKLEQIVLCQTKNADKEKRKKYLRKWYAQQLKEVANRMSEDWYVKTGLRANEIRTKFMKSRWGTCNKKDKRIWLNTQLAFYDKRYLNAVLLHEIGHLKIFNHGPEFKKFMDMYLPSWKSIKKELNSFIF